MSDHLVLKDKPSRSWLIQRLSKPTKFVNPFSPGLGFQSEASKMLSEVLSFEYMGSAEFEFGAVPEAFRFLASQAEIKNLMSGKIGDVFYICPNGYRDEVEKTIGNLITDESNLHLKDRCGLASSLKKNPSEKESIGWIELDNGFMFFVDLDMFNQVKKIFGI